jgi:hypothetical protein
MNRYESFSAWRSDQSSEHKAIIAKLQKLVVKIAPNLIENSKWGNGCWLKGKLPLLYIHTKEDHLQFGFFAGSMLYDSKKMLKGNGKFVRHVRIEKLEDIDVAILSSLIRSALKAPAYK